MKMLSRLMLVVVCVSLSGCAINRATGTFDPGRDLVNTDVFYVERFAPDDRNLHKMIAFRSCR
jgi:hypothetical protein